MKNIPVNDVGAIRNELRKYKSGKKLDIALFNQAARLAWLGRVALSPLDPEDPDCRAWLLHAQPPEGLAEHLVETDMDLLARIHILDAEQGDALARIIEQGVQERAAALQELNRRDFYFDKFFKPRGSGTE